MKFVLGVDEAGRGPVIGPMVMTIAACDSKAEMKLSTLGIRDSKLLNHQKRKDLLPIIKQHCQYKTIVISPEEIDEAVLDPSRNLNILEAEVTGKLINAIVEKLGEKEVEKIILDCPTSNIPSYITLMKRYVKYDVRLVAEHKADFKYPIVGAASIIAKVKRDELIEKLKKDYNVDLGSGYPGDAQTARFVRMHYKEYPFFRKTWATYKAAQAHGNQSTLGAFSAEPILSENVKKKKKLLMTFTANGLQPVETKGTSEVLRLKGEGVTITLYATGKILVQGKNKFAWEQRL